MFNPKYLKLTHNIFVLLTLLLGVLPLAAEPPIAPSSRLAEDGFPTGPGTAEGAACDFARAFIRRDPTLFLAVCLKPYGGAETKAAYTSFLESVEAEFKKDAKQSEPPSEAVTSLAKCYAARPFSRNGPASYGYATFGFQNVMFVDVNVNLQNGKTRLNRTLVVQDKDGRWLVHPRPDLSPLLSMGLSAEDRSEKDFSSASLTTAAGATPAPKPLPLSPNRHAQLTAIFKRLISEIELKSAKNPKMKEIYDRYSSPPGAAVEGRLSEMVTALIQLSATDADAKMLVDRYGIQNTPAAR